MTLHKSIGAFAIASLVLVIVGIFGLFIVSIVAVVLGYVARREMRGDPALAGRGYATAGVVLGWIGIVLPIVVIALWFA